MSRSKQIHLGTILQSVGHTVAWHHPEHASFTAFDSFVRLAQTAERGLFDFVFLAEGLVVREHRGGFFGPIINGRPDSLALPPALAAATERIGLAATISTTYNEPFELAIALTLAAYEQYDATMPPGAWPLYAAAIRETLSDEASGALIVVAEGGTLVGSALLVPPMLEPPAGRAAQPYPEIRLVAVAPAARRRGVATTLLHACIERARASGFTTVGLHSTAYMADAIRIYQRLGFVRATEHDFQSQSGVLVMGFRLDLTGVHT